MKLQTVIRYRTGIRLLLILFVISAIFSFGMIVLCAGSIDYMDETGTYNADKSNAFSQEALIASAVALFCAGGAFGCYNVEHEITKIIHSRIRRVNRHAPKTQNPTPHFILYARRKQICHR